MTSLPIAYIISTVVVLLVVYLVMKAIFSSRKVDNFGSKFVLITGCDSGFGKVTAIRFDRLGFHVIATCLTKAGQEDLRKVCSERVTTLSLDVTDSQQIKEVYSTVTRSIIPRGVGLWALVNNAGISVMAPAEWQSMDDYKRTADVNLWGLIDMTKTFLPLLKKTKGRLVNFSSVAGRVAAPYSSSYCVTKYGVEGFSDALRGELRPWGVKVSIMEPGAFNTNIVQVDQIKKTWDKKWNELSAETKEELGEDYCDKAFKAISVCFCRLSDDLGQVVDAVQDAVTSCTPRDRYLIGNDAKMLALIAMLPSWLSDAFFHAVLKIPSPRKMTAN